MHLKNIWCVRMSGSAPGPCLYGRSGEKHRFGGPLRSPRLGRPGWRQPTQTSTSRNLRVRLPSMPASNRPPARYASSRRGRGEFQSPDGCLVQQLGESGDRYVSPYNVARIYRAIDDKARALEWLERAYQEHNPDLIELTREPSFARLHSDAKFRDLARRIGWSAWPLLTD
jgi:hypothetical protein